MACSLNLTLSGPNIIIPGNSYTYTVTGIWSFCTSGRSIDSISLPYGWTLVSQTPVIGSTATFVVIPGSSAGPVIVTASCTGTSCIQILELPVFLNDTIQSNIGICCSSFGVASLDISAWSFSHGSSTLTITFGNATDAIAALGASSFTSAGGPSAAGEILDLVNQINAAAAANPGANPEGLSPASLVSSTFSITSWPTPNDTFPCGVTTLFAFGFQISCSTCDPVGDLYPVRTVNFTGDGTVINCIGPPAITGSNFVCTGQQSSYIVTFPLGIPLNYTVIPPIGWALVSVTVTSPTTLSVVLVPDSTSGVLTVSDTNGMAGYSTSITLINDCFVSNCASEMLLSQFCNDQDICCVECDDFKKKQRQIERNMYNKAIALLTTYALAKQNYFVNCNPSDLTTIQTLLQQIQSILIRCEICPEIN